MPPGKDFHHDGLARGAQEGVMVRSRIFTSALLLFQAFTFSLVAMARAPLTFEERVKAQESIERVYYAHRIWPKDNPQPKPPFEEMVPREVIEAKVADYLKKCVALDKYWQRPIQPEQLQAEMNRMTKGTKDPATLGELFTALNNDPCLIAECLARPVLADRFAQNWYASDTRFHGELKTEALALRDKITPANFPEAGAQRFHAVKIELDNPSSVRGPKTPESILHRLGATDFQKALEDYPEVGAISEVEETNEAFVIRWTKSRLEESLEGGVIVFEKTPFNTWFEKAKRVLPTTLSSIEIAYVLKPLGSAVPLTESACSDSWKAIWSIPDPRRNHNAVWTGTEMIVWGGDVSWRSLLNTGGRYNPATDTWLPTSTGINCPGPRENYSVVWTGIEMIVWGGVLWQNGSSIYEDTGGRYNPDSDTWTAIAIGVNCPSARDQHTAVWTGTEMIVWGGLSCEETTCHYYDSGGKYNPNTDSWVAISTGAVCPIGRYSHHAVWTGTEMIIWGGFSYDGTDEHYENSGCRYNPNSDSWKATSTGVNCPSGRYSHTAVWTGTEMIIWGGDMGGPYLNTGGRYNPYSDSWMDTSIGVNCPAGRIFHTAVWTGTEMIVWGEIREAYPDYLRNGGRYNPTSDTWSATSTGENCPTERCLHTSVWTGTEMIVWGGSTGSALLVTGGRYNPFADSWIATSMGAGPTGRSNATSVWTGTEIIVWGGDWYVGGPQHYERTGGRYDPAMDSWLPTSTGTNCPTPRSGHIAIWNGSEMIVWGGGTGYPIFNSGGRYNPTFDTWSATSTGTNCPTPRSGHIAIWTGTEMIVWGGGMGTPVEGTPQTQILGKRSQRGLTAHRAGITTPPFGPEPR
jgi:N-acetylneuraminic acid mutarotase